MKFFPQKEHLNVFGVSVDSLPYFFRFSLSFAEHQNIVQPNWTLDVAGDNASLVSPFQDSYSYLNDLTSDAGAANDLCDFSRY